MKEKKGQGTLYLVIGIATLVVAIIGATFAYFSAQATSADKVQGGTNTELSTALTLNVERQLFGEAESESYNNLVPAVIDVTTDGIKKVVDNKLVIEDALKITNVGGAYLAEAMEAQEINEIKDNSM